MGVVKVGTVVDEKVFDVGENLVHHLQPDVGDDSWVFNHVRQAALDQLRVAHLAWIHAKTRHEAAHQAAPTQTCHVIYFKVLEEHIHSVNISCRTKAKAESGNMQMYFTDIVAGSRRRIPNGATQTEETLVQPF